MADPYREATEQSLEERVVVLERDVLELVRVSRRALDAATGARRLKKFEFVDWQSVGMWSLGWGLSFWAAFGICTWVTGDSAEHWGIRTAVMVTAFGAPFGLRAIGRAWSGWEPK